MIINEQELAEKFCTKCKVCKKVEEFRCIKRNPDGTVKYLSSWCGECCNKSALDRKGGRVKYIPKVEGNSKECYICRTMKPKSDFSPTSRGRLGVSAYCKVCVLTRVDKTEESRRKAAERTKVYRERNKHRWRAMHRIHQFNRRSKIKATEDGTVTDEFLKFIYSKTECYWCKLFTEEDKRTLEHIVELNDGGKHSAENITMACLSCNSARKGKLK